MTEIEVDVERVAATASAARACAARIESEVETLQGHLLTLEQIWRGPASSAFGQLGQRWRATQQRVVAELRVVAGVLATSAGHYADAEADAMRRMRS